MLMQHVRYRGEIEPHITHTLHRIGPMFTRFTHTSHSKLFQSIKDHKGLMVPHLCTSVENNGADMTVQLCVSNNTVRPLSGFNSLFRNTIQAIEAKFRSMHDET